MNARRAALLAVGASALVGGAALVVSTTRPRAPSPVATEASSASDAAPGDAAVLHAAASDAEAADGSEFDAGDGAALCAPLRAANAAVLAKLVARGEACRDPSPTEIAMLDSCVGTDQGVWAYRFSRFDAAARCGDATLSARRIYVDRRGRVASSGDVEPWFSRMAEGTSAPSRFEAVDYDGDGNAELIVGESYSGEGGDGPDAVYTAHGTDVVSYPPVANLHAQTFADVDGDGLPDALTRGPYQGAGSSLGIAGTPALELPIFVYHASGGRFVLDEVSRRALAASCEGVVFPPDAESDIGTAITTTGLSVVCARARGKSAKEVRAATTPLCPKLCEMPSDCDSSWYVTSDAAAGGPDGATDDASARARCPYWLDLLVDTRPPLKLP